MLKKSPPTGSDATEEIIDLTEIIQKGKPPLQSKVEVDFDSALSDLMGKVPSVKLQETPELQELLSGIDEVAQTRERHAPEPDRVINLSEMDDVDSLVSALETPRPNKEEQPDEEVDSLLDSLMGDLNPPDTSQSKGPEISEADLDDLLDTIEQESSGKEVSAKTEPSADYSMDDLLSGLDKVHAKPEKAASADTASPSPPADLDDLLAGLDLSPAPAPKVAPITPKAAPMNLDEMLAGLDMPEVAPKAPPAAKATPKAAPPDDLDDLLAGLDMPEVPASKPAKPVADELADFGDLESAPPSAAPGKSASAKKADNPSPAQGSLFDAGDLDDLDSLFVDASKPSPAPAPEKVAAIPEEVVSPAADTVSLSPSELTALRERMDAMEDELTALRNKVVTLEEHNAELATLASGPATDPVVDTLSDGLSELEDRVVTLEKKATEDIPAPAPELVEMPGRMTVLESRVGSVENTLTQVAEQVKQASEVEPPKEDSTAMEALENLARRVQELEDHMQNSETDEQESEGDLEQRLAALEARPYVPVETIQSAFDQMGVQINGPLQQFQNRITALEQRLGDNIALLAEELTPLMSHSIDRAAAESAARALREELAAMLGEDGDASDLEDDEDEDVAEADSFADLDIPDISGPAGHLGSSDLLDVSDIVVDSNPPAFLKK